MSKHDYEMNNHKQTKREDEKSDEKGCYMLEHKCYYHMNLDLISPFLLAAIIGTN